MVDSGCKSEFAKLLQVDRTCLYRNWNKQQEKDESSINELQKAHIINPRYGVRRLAIVLAWSEDKTRRIRNLAGVEALRKSKKRYKTSTLKEIDAPENKLKAFWEYKNPEKPWLGYNFSRLTDPTLNIWTQDFTYISWHGKFLYFAVTFRIASREVLGWSFGFYHDADLVTASLEDALRNNDAPNITHTDQGSEYLSQKNFELCKNIGTVMSASDPGQPWQNGFMERFFNTFKEEMEEKLKRCKTSFEVYERIANWVYYYNYERIHTSLKMSPKDYAARLQKNNLSSNVLQGVPEMNASHSLRLPSHSVAV